MGSSVVRGSAAQRVAGCGGSCQQCRRLVVVAGVCVGCVLHVLARQPARRCMLQCCSWAVRQQSLPARCLTIWAHPPGQHRGGHQLTHHRRSAGRRRTHGGQGRSRGRGGRHGEARRRRGGLAVGHWRHRAVGQGGAAGLVDHALGSGAGGAQRHAGEGGAEGRLEVERRAHIVALPGARVGAAVVDEARVARWHGVVAAHPGDDVVRATCKQSASQLVGQSAGQSWRESGSGCTHGQQLL